MSTRWHKLPAFNAQRALAAQQRTMRGLRPAFQDPEKRQQKTDMLLNMKHVADIQQGLEVNLTNKTREHWSQHDHAVIRETSRDRTDTKGQHHRVRCKQRCNNCLP